MENHLVASGQFLHHFLMENQLVDTTLKNHLTTAKRFFHENKKGKLPNGSQVIFYMENKGEKIGNHA